MSQKGKRVPGQAVKANTELLWDGSCARLTLTRADKLNPLDWATVRELRDAVAEIEVRSEISTVIVTGQGRSFSAGGDLDGYIGLYREPAQFAAFLQDFYAMLTAIEMSAKIYIATVNGYCVAGGLELLLACDLVVAAESAKIGDGHITFGQLPGAGGSQRLPRAVGLLRAKHLMLTGELISAEDARQMGLVNRVVPDAELAAAATALARQLDEKSRVGLRGAKYLANLTLSTDLATGLQQEIEYVHRYATTERDATEGLVAFREKRKPVFSS
jgi:enoyl-CoA hydratase/carnithine racemase